MHKLPAELQRLYLTRPPVPAGAETPPPSLAGPDGTVRALVMELARTPDWEVLSRVWQGVQAELDLPAPAIAVSGTDALQLWFSLAEPVAAAQAHAFLKGLRQRFLPDVDARRVRLLPTPDLQRQAQPVPAAQADTGNWSAFVAPDLAPVFGDTPWLDIPPNEEGQANLLRGIAVTKKAAFDAALQALGTPAPRAAPAVQPQVPKLPRALDVPQVLEAAGGEAVRFLRRVMDDESVPMALRIEAAKALLPPSGQRG
ncbi:hypothetical protein [Pseudorhodoferax sp. Leaf274]|uniref:hypothetical protein n=1 Tax=Pseudorhodoferax sp. Leaf274 TaxID=1736318 RepID=UPI0007026E12|nr:hypothetical protein [Pseudorhodoferax sp. Leaf274]KQP35560.1 hypothetical protein ASF44_19725 [Pseudorhodoferax sp. Leaf274]